MEWEFRDTDKDISIVRIDMEDFWEDDPAEDPFVSNKGKAKYSKRNIKADKIIDVLDMSGIKRPGDLGISRDEWLADVSKKLTELHGGGGIPDYTTMPAYGLKRAKKGKHKFFVPKGEKLPAGVAAIKENKHNWEEIENKLSRHPGITGGIIGSQEAKDSVDAWMKVLKVGAEQMDFFDSDPKALPVIIRQMEMEALGHPEMFGWFQDDDTIGQVEDLASYEDLPGFIETIADKMGIINFERINEADENEDKDPVGKSYSNQPIVYVDMDGVLVDFFGEWANMHGVDGWRDILPLMKSQGKTIDDALDEIRARDDFWINLKPHTGAKALLAAIKKYVGEYIILSSPLSNDPNSEPQKRAWVKNNLSAFPPKEVIIHKRKQDYATQADGTPNILIDDFSNQIKPWDAAGGIALKHSNSNTEKTVNALKQQFESEVNEATQKFYHGSYDKLDVDTVLTPGGDDYESSWGGTNFYGPLEKFRPPEKLAHKEGVFMVGNDDDVDVAGGATDYVYVVEPIGEVQKHDLNWGSEISMLIDNGHTLNDPEVKEAAENYWNGVPHHNEQVWEYLAPRAKIVGILDEAWKVKVPKKNKRKMSKQDKDWSMLRTALESDLFEAGTGDCFEVANRAMIDMTEEQEITGMKCVHAYVYGQGELKGRRFPHAWNEQGDVVFDNSNGNNIVMRKEQYYALGGIVQESGAYATYDKEDCLIKMLKHSHYGPWDLNDSLDENIPDEVKEIGKKKSRIPRNLLNTIEDELNLDAQVETAWERFKSNVA